MPWGVLCAAGALLTWLLVAPRTPDLAAAAYRLDLFKHLGFAVYDEHWYGGHDLPGYSVLFPPLAWLLGLRAVGALSVLVSTLCFERLAFARYGSAGRWASVAFALAAVGDVWIGRLAFALGLAFAMAAVLVFAGARTPARTTVAGLLAAMSAAASPVAGALLALAAASESLWQRSPRSLLALGVPAVFVVLALAALFPEGGTEPYPTVSFLATALVVVAFAAALPRGEGRLRLGAGVYLLVSVVLLLVPTPVGSNVERYGVLLAGPLLICAVVGARERGVPRSAVARALAAVAFGLWAVWAGWGPVRETLAVASDPSTNGAFYAPVERFLASHARGGPVRIEVPLTRTHWETAELAPRVSLARGWEKQLDERYDGVLLSSALSPANYEHWLREQAVSYVALPSVKLDPSSAREGDLIRAGLPYLRLVYFSRHWRIYAVRAPTPIAVGPGRLTLLGHESFGLTADAPGGFFVRVRWTPYWRVVRGNGCVSRAAGGWTRVRARRPGPLLVRADFSFSRAFSSSGEACASG
ncbi:MAG TPA: hypothetical protein VMB05_14725 [Solirubrobacteraceae bacterium]|nr:hypothetical protein [Solirubrobacteraceae bacterium]